MKLRPYLRKAQFYETDGMGIIYHGNYIHWMEEARVDFLDQLGWGYEKAVEAGIDFAVTDVSCRYRSMTRFGECVSIEMRIDRLSPARMQLSYVIADAKTGEVRAEGTSGHCFYDRAKGRPVALKRALPEVYARLAACLPPHEEEG